MTRLIGAVFGLAIIISPVYVFPSGNPQPADLLMVLASLLMLISATSGIPIKGIKTLELIIALSIWVLVVNTIWEVIYPREGSYKYPLFFLFNLMLMFLALNVRSDTHSFRRWLAAPVQLALILSFVGILVSIVSPGFLGTKEHYRVIGFYNNPNQLAFNHLCLLGILLLIEEGKIPRHPISFIAFVAGLMGIIAATSLAAIGGVLVMSAGILVSSLSSRRVIPVLLMIASAVVVFTVIDSATGNAISEEVLARQGAAERKLSDMASERKYDRIAAFPQYWIVGAAEGGEERFYPYIGGEIHSSFGILLFCYGLPGLLLFIVFLWRVARHMPLGCQLVMLSLLVYSLSHMGLRTTTFWLFLASAIMLYNPRYRSHTVTAQSRYRTPKKAKFKAESLLWQSGR